MAIICFFFFLGGGGAKEDGLVETDEKTARHSVETEPAKGSRGF